MNLFHSPIWILESVDGIGADLGIQGQYSLRLELYWKGQCHNGVIFHLLIHIKFSFIKTI